MSYHNNTAPAPAAAASSSGSSSSAYDYHDMYHPSSSNANQHHHQHDTSADHFLSSLDWNTTRSTSASNSNTTSNRINSNSSSHSSSNTRISSKQSSDAKSSKTDRDVIDLLNDESMNLSLPSSAHEYDGIGLAPLSPLLAQMHAQRVNSPSHHLLQYSY